MINADLSSCGSTHEPLTVDRRRSFELVRISASKYQLAWFLW